MAKNVLFIIADQWRADTLGCAGHPCVRTPNLDALAAEGTRFSNAFVQTAPCGPSRMCIFTSKYLCATRSINNHTPLENADENFGTALRASGRAPGLIGYNDYTLDPRTLPPEDPRTRTLDYDNFLPGFERVYFHDYDSPEYFASLRRKGYPEALLNHDAIHKPDVPPEGPGARLPLCFPAKYKEEDSECRFLTEKAIEYLDTQSEGWFLSLNYIKPHPPRICCAPYHAMYDPAQVPLPDRSDADLNHAHPYLKALYREPSVRSEQGLRETRANYYGMISEVDANLGRLFEHLKKTGQWDQTLVVFTSDHGEYLGDHYLMNKGHFYDGALRVPLIVRDPDKAAGATRGKTIDSFIEAIDHAPAMLEWLGVPRPEYFQGQSYLALVHGSKNATRREEVHFEYDFRRMKLPGLAPERQLLWAVRDAHYKYVQFADPSLPNLLFDLRQDPGEDRNVAADPARAGVVAEFAQRLLRWRMANEDQRMERWATQFRK